MGLRIRCLSYLCQYLDVCTRSLLGGYVVDHFNENTLIYGVLSFVALALISTFTFAKGLNNPKATCEN